VAIRKIIMDKALMILQTKMLTIVAKLAKLITIINQIVNNLQVWTVAKVQMLDRKAVPHQVEAGHMAKVSFLLQKKVQEMVVAPEVVT